MIDLTKLLGIDPQKTGLPIPPIVTPFNPNGAATLPTLAPPVNQVPGMPPANVTVPVGTRENPQAIPDEVLAGAELTVPAPPPLPSPGDLRYNNARAEYEKAVAAPAEKQNPWLQGLFLGLQGIKKATNPNDDAPIELLGNHKKRLNMEKAATALAPLQQQRQTDQKYRAGEVAIENTREDNALNRERVEMTREARESERKSRSLNRILGLKHFDPKNPTHAAAAKNAGLTPEELQGWDDRNPVEKQVAGITYRMNRNTGAYEPTNLPQDEAKTLTDYTVTMPNGEKRTYKVSQKDAANFSTQMSTLGIRLEHQSQENSKDRALTLQRDALKAQMDAALKQYDAAIKNRDQTQAEAHKERLLQLKNEYDALDQ
jgi:hypothetical protein